MPLSPPGSPPSSPEQLVPDNNTCSSGAVVSFCAIQVEISDDAPDVDIAFNRGKSLEDVFERLTISSETDMSSRRRSRGRREAGQVMVQTITPDESPAAAASSLSSSKESTPASSGSRDGQEDQLKFSSGNPFVEVTKGVIHLYKENEATSLEEGVIRSQMLCMLSVSSKIKTPDLLSFTSPCYSELEMMRIIQDGSPNQFMVLLRFRCQEAADEFYQAFNGQRFNSLEADVCSLVYVSKVETCKESEFYPMAGHTELPVCSICLERMDESISTVLTILCNHSFHGSCLAQWEDSTCPVCRYVQTPEVVAEQRCSDCKSADDLWICLICGYVGCGRYVGGHSHAHFLTTQHCYTMELGQNRVWDYVGDNFVHRLVQTDSADGKLVEAEGGFGGDGIDMFGCPDGHNHGRSKCLDGVAVNSDEKLDSIQLEYTYLLTSQLEAQRRYYEEKISHLEEHASREVEELAERARQAVEESKESEARLCAIMKEKSKVDQKLSQTNTRISRLSEELTEEKHMNESLRKNQEEWQKKFEAFEKNHRDQQETKDQEISELKDQLRDVMFFVEAQNTIAQSPLKDELQEGAVSVGAASNSGVKKAQRKKKRGK